MTATLDAPEFAPAEILSGGHIKDERRAAARAELGVAGGDVNAEPLAPILKRHNLTLYPTVALGLLGFVDVFQGDALTVVTPEVSTALGVSFGVVGAARALQFLATVVAPLPMAALSQKRNRAILCVVTALAWSGITLLTGFVTSLLALIGVLVADGLSTGSVLALHSPMLADTYPPAARVRIQSAYAAIQNFGHIAAPLLVALLAGPFHLTWRGVFLGLGLLSTAITLVGLGLKDPTPGKFDTEALHQEVAHEDALLSHTDVKLNATAHNTELGFFEIFRRLMLVPTIARLMAGFLVFGMLLVPFGTFLAGFLQQRWNLTAAGRGLVIGGCYLFAVIGLVVYGKVAENDFAKDPARVVKRVGNVVIAAVAFIALGALTPVFVTLVPLFGLGMMCIAITGPGLNSVVLSIVDARQRPHVAALGGLFLALGALLGVALLSGVASEYGVAGSIVSLLIPGVAGGLIIRTASKLVSADIDGMVDSIIEEEDLAAFKAAGGRPPMLTSKGINFSYGQLQVLFDVDFSIDEGEMVALLGTNGAGKSTLLKVLSGLNLPQSGTVRMYGDDITYLDAERRVKLGITQIPGGHAVFNRMTVIENLKGYAYTIGADKKRVDAAIERCLEVFPRLEERKNSLGGTLSGGEQQMLGLSKALILQPKLLLIDELSLGLAPVIVGQLLDLVREINATGTAVVLVEQSVNIALSLVDHAYFMEKGQMRFDGPAQELLGRDDLLRAVFLEGATAGQKEGK